MERAETEVKALALSHEEELRRFEALKGMGVDLTKYMCTLADRQPDQHIRIDSAAQPAVHVELAKKK